MACLYVLYPPNNYDVCSTLKSYFEGFVKNFQSLWKTLCPSLFLQHQWEVGDRLGFGGGRCLFPLGQLLDPLRDIKVKHVDGDSPLPCIIRLAINPFHHSFCKSSIPPLRVFERILFPCRGCKNDRPVLGTGQLIDNACDISMRRIGSSGIPDECNSPVKIKRNNIEMDRRVFFISAEIY